ncbi:ephrin type-B receptor 1-B-like isoform X1 [Oculina patagonica]
MEYFWIPIVTILTFVTWTSSRQVVIYSCNGECMKLHWDKIKNKTSKIRGWTESSNSGQQYMTACDVVLSSSDPKPNSWLRTVQINVAAAKMIHITLQFLIKSCPNLDKAYHCVNAFDLYLNQSDHFIQDEHYYPDPLINSWAYKKVAEIRQPTDKKTFKPFDIPVKGRYVLLAFHNYGACSNLYSVEVFFNVCPDEILLESLVSLPITAAPAYDSESIRVEGNCEENTIQVAGSLYVHCTSNGEWNASRLEGRCVCKEDMENIGGKCEDCPDGKYNDQNGLNCTVLPSAPKNVSITFVNQSAVEIRWQPPAITGDLSHVSYDVDCRKSCGGDDDNKCEEACGSYVSYIPNKESLKVTQVIIINLSSFVNYTFLINAMNRASEVAKRKHGVEGNFTTVSVRTKGSIPGKPEVTVKQKGSDVVVSWILEQKNGVIKGYHVTYRREDDALDSEIITTKKEEQKFVDLMEGKTYEIQVIARNNFGIGPAGVKTFTLRNGAAHKSKLIVGPVAGSGGLVLIFLVTVIVMIFFRQRKRQRSLDRIHLRGIEQGTELRAMEPIGQHQYIDPGNYLDLMELLSTFTSELERSKIKLDRLVGQGEFADVYKGTLKTRTGKDVVAVKVLRPGSSEKNQKDFLSEASIVCQFSHPNVIRLKGVVTQNRPMMILTEFLESGSLDHFLKARDRQLTNLQLVGMARGVACGMVYLSGMNFIHRDLAARNVLVGENMSCKVSDFGLSRELSEANQGLAVYQTQGGKIPIRWTAPEALQDRIFSSASDVWSFGIVVWEIMTYCDRPYWDWNNCDVMRRVKSGYRLPPPEGCPKVIHELMLECWDKDKEKRPKFSEIVNRLDNIIRSSEVLNEGITLLVSDISTMEVDVPEFQSVDDWLKAIKMEKYSETLQAANVNNLDKVTQLEDRDLTEMGINLIGHRNKMNRSIKAMKSQFHRTSVDDEEN